MHICIQTHTPQAAKRFSRLASLHTTCTPKSISILETSNATSTSSYYTIACAGAIGVELLSVNAQTGSQESATKVSLDECLGDRCCIFTVCILYFSNFSFKGLIPSYTVCP